MEGTKKASSTDINFHIRGPDIKVNTSRISNLKDLDIKSDISPQNLVINLWLDIRKMTCLTHTMLAGFQRV